MDGREASPLTLKSQQAQLSPNPMAADWYDVGFNVDSISTRSYVTEAESP